MTQWTSATQYVPLAKLITLVTIAKYHLFVAILCYERYHVDTRMNVRIFPIFQKFLTDYETFKEKMADMEQRLAYIVCQAFDDCSGCESAFKLLEMMGPLIERPLIHCDFQYKYPVLIAMYSQELDEAKLIFDKQLALAQTPAGPTINKNMPYVAGVLKWAQELRDRVGGHMEKLRQINHG